MRKLIIDTDAGRPLQRGRRCSRKQLSVSLFSIFSIIET